MYELHRAKLVWIICACLFIALLKMSSSVEVLCHVLACWFTCASSELYVRPPPVPSTLMFCWAQIFDVVFLRLTINVVPRGWA